MSVINAQNNGVTDALRAAATSRAESFAAKTAPKNEPKSVLSQPRNANDTVSLSKTGQKIVNLGRVTTLANDIKNAPMDKNFASTLKQATEDNARIGNLFTQTVRALLKWFQTA